MLSFFVSAALLTTAAALSCSDLGLISGGHPKTTKAVSYSGNSPQTSSITWSASSTEDTSLTSTVTCTEGTGAESDSLIITSTGIPAHRVGEFPMTFSTTGKGHNDNPNTIASQSYTWTIPKYSVKKATVPQSIQENTRALPQGPIGFALNGVPFYNAFNSKRLDAVSRDSSGYEVMDLCHGHPDMHGRYHYHYQQETDGCLFGSTDAQIKTTAGQRSPKIGYAFDGIPIYGPLGKGGVAPTDLDACNGRMDTDLGQYVYHTTNGKSPYIIGCYMYTKGVKMTTPALTESPQNSQKVPMTKSPMETQANQQASKPFTPTSRGSVTLPAIFVTALSIMFYLAF